MFSNNLFRPPQCLPSTTPETLKPSNIQTLKYLVQGESFEPPQPHEPVDVRLGARASVTDAHGKAVECHHRFRQWKHMERRWNVSDVSALGSGSTWKGSGMSVTAPLRQWKHMERQWNISDKAVEAHGKAVEYQ